MCTGIFRKGKDIIYGFNLDIDPNVWNYSVYKAEDYFTVGIRVGKTLYFTHGVNKEGHFSNLPYMNDYTETKGRNSKNRERIDLLTDRYIRNKYSFADVLEILATKEVVNIPKGSMHSLIGNGQGRVIIVEPGYGYKEVTDNYAVITNYPLLGKCTKFDPWFGKERFDIASEMLKNTTEDFSALDALKILREVKQEGIWATRVSFVYSRNENCVYYVMNNDYDHVSKHELGGKNEDRV